MLEFNTRVTVTVDGSNLGTWTTKSGGQVEADDTKFRPGGMLPQLALGGFKSVENVTVSRIFDGFMQLQFHTIANKVGTAPMSVTYQPLDKNGNPYGRPITYSGKLIRCTPPDADANSSDVAMIELELSTDGAIA